jgi:2-polyprenyl-3-methyl-5-hydroxy-6-metoxy-1,4-benzoquinol methylase
MSRAEDYPLGYSELEARRLAEQGALLEDLTANVFRRAGLREGMTVLDIGCGVGDVTLLAAQLAGPKGAVLGIDRAASSVQTARVRATASAAEIDIDTLAVRMYEDALMHERVMFLPRTVGAWTALPPGE